MAMRELMKITLDNSQVCEACEIAVRDRLSPDLASQDIRATCVFEDGVITVDVVITKKRAPKKTKVAT